MISCCRLILWQHFVDWGTGNSVPPSCALVIDLQDFLHSFGIITSIYAPFPICAMEIISLS